MAQDRLQVLRRDKVDF